MIIHQADNVTGIASIHTHTHTHNVSTSMKDNLTILSQLHLLHSLTQEFHI